MAKNRHYKLRLPGGIPFSNKKWWVLCKDHLKQVLFYLELAGERWEVLKGDKTTSSCYYCENPDGVVNPLEFERD